MIRTIRPTTSRPTDMSTWWSDPRPGLAALVLALGLLATTPCRGQDAAPTTSPAAALAGAEAAVPGVPALVDAPGLDRRQRSLDAREQRMSLWEAELARRAEGEAYFADLEGYVTPRELLASLVLAILGGAGLALLGGRLLPRIALGRPRAGQSQRELEALERRVLTGLRELDQLLGRLTDRVLTQPPAAEGPAPAAALDGAQPGEVTLDPPRARAPRTRPAAPRPSRDAAPAASTRLALAEDRLGGTEPELPPPHPVREDRLAAGRPGGESRRAMVLELARRGYDPDEIGRRTQLGPAEVGFILRLAAAR